jgi:hypothetical protein
MCPEAQNQHLVSRGLQNNFALDKRVAVLDAHSGAFVELRPTKSNFQRPDFNAYLDLSGSRVNELEDEWAKREQKVLNQIRQVSVTNCGPDLQAAIASLFAIHLVRSQAYHEAHKRILEQVRSEVGQRLELDVEARRLFVAEHGREPAPGDISALVALTVDAHEAANRTFVDSMVKTHNRLIEMFTEWSVQVVATDPLGPGFVLADVPVAHADTDRGRYGFRDDLAIGDADLIIGPLTRWTAALFTSTGTRHTTLRTKKQLQVVNAVLWRAASQEVACHPDDERDARRVHAHLRDLPVQLLVRG